MPLSNLINDSRVCLEQLGPGMIPDVGAGRGLAFEGWYGNGQSKAAVPPHPAAAAAPPHAQPALARRPKPPPALAAHAHEVAQARPAAFVPSYPPPRAAPPQALVARAPPAQTYTETLSAELAAAHGEITRLQAQNAQLLAALRAAGQYAMDCAEAV